VNTEAKATILVVDDNPENLRPLLTFLRELGFNTQITMSGERVLQRIDDLQPDLILLDVMMPGIDGFETCRRLKQHATAKDIPVIFMTALSDTMDKLKGFEAGGVDYITKPIQYEELLARVNVHLTIRRLQQQLQKQNLLLEEQNERFRRLVEASFEGIIIYDNDRIVDLNQKLLKLFGYERSEILSLDGLPFVTSECRDAVANYIYTGDEQPYEATGIRKDGSSFPIELQARAMPYQGHEVRVVAVRDITWRKQAEEMLRQAHRDLAAKAAELEEMSLTDPLTGMRNRRYLTNVIDTVVAKVHRDYNQRHVISGDGRPVNPDIAFLMLDLDHFKSVNDTYGHEAGDRALIQLRHILDQACRETDILVRWGGEEFLIVSRYTNREYVQTITERIRERVEEYAFDIGDRRTLHLTCSIGATSYPFLPDHPDWVNWEQTVAIADKALYMAKISGRNAWVNIIGTETTRPEKLLPRIQYEIEALVEAGELRVAVSFLNA
jgi:two-component system cell cycle response regulator